MKSDDMKDQKVYEELEREARTLKRVANGIVVASLIVSSFVVWRVWPLDASMAGEQISGWNVLVMILTPVIVLWPTIGLQSAVESLVVTIGAWYFIDPSMRGSFLPDWWGYVMAVSMACSAFKLAKLVRERLNQI